jgi:hypothetical protein
MHFKFLFLFLVALLLCSACNKKQGKDLDGPETKVRTAQHQRPTIKESEQLAAQIETELMQFAQRIASGDLPDPFTNDEQWSQLSGRLTNSSKESHKVKVSIFEISHDKNIIQASANMEIKARLDNQNYFGQITRFKSSWSENADGKLKVLEISAPLQTVVNESPALWFSDETERLTSNEPAFEEHLSKGLDFWLKRIESIHGIDAFINNGMAVGDFDGDGRDDIYVCQPGGLPNRLFLHRANHTITEAPEKTGANFLDHTSAALFIDIDNDGDQDLTLATPSGIVLLENDKHQSLTARGILQTDEVDCHSLTATDFDLDGNLDLLITFALGSRSLDDDSSFRFDDARDGGSNQLFRGDGNWSFSEVTALSGLSEGNDRHSLAASWHDYDLDGDPDLYIANDYGPNQLYRNDSRNGTRFFTEIAKEAGTEDRGAGMSVSWADYNRDGLPDLYVGNMYSNAGKRITGLNGFLPKNKAKLTKHYRRFAKGNTLFMQKKDGKFIDAGTATTMGRWAWSSVFADLDNDGWEDLIVANGYISGPRPDDL